MTPMNRRRALSALGTVSLATLLASCGDDGPPATSTAQDALEGAGTCRLTAEQTEGPYYFDADRVRSDIREDRPGTTLKLALRVRDAETCEPIADAVVDLWHCDAGGVYSGFEAGEGERFLRGAQVTGKDGIAEFTTIYPGWYPGRTVHIHAKVHLDSRTALTTQLYFDDATSEAVYGRGAPYVPGRDQSNDSDGLFDASLLLTLKADGDGYLGALGFDVARS